MFTKSSRYRSARPFVGRGEDSFRGVRPREIGPAEGVIEHTVKEGDRLDLLARHYYNDDRLWWRILDANPEILFGEEATLAVDQGNPGDPDFLTAMIGRTLAIPRAEEPR